MNKNGKKSAERPNGREMEKKQRYLVEPTGKGMKVDEGIKITNRGD